MSHILDEILRRSVDESDVMLAYEKEHLLQCTRCRSRLEALRSRAAFAATNLNAAGDVDIEAAHRSILRRSGTGLQTDTEPRPRRAARTLQWTSALAAALLLFLFIGYSPLRGVAANFLAVFEPHQFQPIGFTAADITALKSLPDLKAFGTMHESGARRFNGFGTDASAAARFARMPVLRAAYLPDGVPRTATYHASGTHTVTVTFTRSKMRTMPSTIAGSTMTASIGPVLIQSYGDTAAWETRGKRSAHGVRSGDMHMPSDTIVITQARAPKVYSTKAGLAQIEAWLIAQPGVPADVAEQIKSIGDPATTVPVPIQLDKQMAQTVSVQGVSGLLIGDNTGLGSVVMWQKGGMVYAVAGPFAASQIVQVANALAQ